MPRLSQSQQRAREAILGAAASGYGIEALGRRIVAALQGAIPVDGYRLFGVDPKTLLINRLLAASDTDDWARAEWLREVYLRAGELGYIELPVLMQTGLTAVAFHEHLETCWGYPRTSFARVDPGNHRRLFHEQRSPAGGTLLACFPADGFWVAAIQAYRREPKLPFRAGDVEFVRMMAPVIGKAVAAAVAKERAAQIAPADDEASGILILNANGAVQLATPAAEAWCARIAEPGSSRLNAIPTAVWASIAKLRAGEDPAAFVIAPSESGQVRVEASPAGLDGSVAIVLTPLRPTGRPEAPAEWPLTVAERRVVDLALRGKANGEIANALFLSVNTVEWHLRSAYGKLGVNSRMGMLAALFEASAPPELVDSTPATTGAAATRP